MCSQTQTYIIVEHAAANYYMYNIGAITQYGSTGYIGMVVVV